MRILSPLAFLLILGAPGVFGQSEIPTSAQPDRSYKLLREDEDWSFLQDAALRRDFWDPIKYVPLRSSDAHVPTIGATDRVSNRSR